MQGGLTRWERELIESLNDQLAKGVSYTEEFVIIGRILRVQHWARQRINLERRMAERVRAAAHAWREAPAPSSVAAADAGAREGGGWDVVGVAAR